MKNIRLFFTITAIVLTINTNAQTYSFDFTGGYDGWTGDFADYPVSDSIFYELEFVRTTLPPPLNTGKYALKITGNNHSDDLFMFIKRKISGLNPNTTYKLQVEVNIASNAPTSAFGIGGAPGEGVTLKSGASVVEPLKRNVNGLYFMNIDKSNQADPGVDMDTIGHLGVSDTTTVYTFINRNNISHLFTFTTDSNGETWVCIGTDSGFEATTAIYYNQIKLSFAAVLGIDNPNQLKDISIFPNPASTMLYVKSAPVFSGQTYSLTDLLGRTVSEGILTSEITGININELPNGLYIIVLGEQKKQTFKVIKK